MLRITFYRELHAVILRDAPDLSIPAANLDADALLEFAGRFTPLCPSRWNALVTMLRGITPHGKLLSRRPGCGCDGAGTVTPGASRFLGSHVNLKLPDSPAVSRLAKITAVRRSVRDSGATADLQFRR